MLDNLNFKKKKKKHVNDKIIGKKIAEIKIIIDSNL